MSVAVERPRVLADLVNPVGLSLVGGMAKASFALRAPALPLSLALDVVMFGLFGLGVGFMARWSRWLSVAVLVLPSIILAADIVRRVGLPVHLGEVGSDWAASLLLVPAAAFAGAALGGRLADRRG
jgi:hypothetical protein